jgi:hypothetical protein
VTCRNRGSSVALGAPGVPVATEMSGIRLEAEGAERAGTRCRAPGVRSSTPCSADSSLRRSAPHYDVRVAQVIEVTCRNRGSSASSGATERSGTRLEAKGHALSEHGLAPDPTDCPRGRTRWASR